MDKNHSYEIGQNYFVRTVTYHYTGRLIGVTSTDIVLADAAWVADSGRFANALATGELSEVEVYPDAVIIQRTAIVDSCLWNHSLPRETK